MTDDAPEPAPEQSPAPAKHQRRKRYAGKYPKRFDEKYKELNPEKYAATLEKILASGKTPAGTHRPICVTEILEILKPQPGEIVVDATLGYGGHAREILSRLQPGGRLIGLDVDPIEQPRTEKRLREAGFGPETFTVCHSNFAGIQKVLAKEQIEGVDMVLADLGCSSMQFDDPSRGFSFKTNSPLDLRMNPNREPSAASLLAKISESKLEDILRENSDEPHAQPIAQAIIEARQHKPLTTTSQLTRIIEGAMERFPKSVQDSEGDKPMRRVFQALRIAVNDEFSALDTLLRTLPFCLKPGGRVAILTFHSGEDRRVKKAFREGLDQGLYAKIADDVIRPSRDEIHANPRASSAKLRWAVKALTD